MKAGFKFKKIIFPVCLHKQCFFGLVFFFLTTPVLCEAGNHHATFNGMLTEFPIGVWLQNPDNAEEYKKIGINLYVGLHKGPTQRQLEQLRKAGVFAIANQNETGLADTDVIVAWLQADEPDNAQKITQPGKSARYGPPLTPSEIIQRYKNFHLNDPLSRPVFLNFGQGVAWNEWWGRGTRTNHPEDYVQYARGGDILSFDVYPAVSTIPQIAGNLSLVGRGVERLIRSSQGNKPVWSILSASRINNPEADLNVSDIRSQVWMSIINGARGIVYFVHQFKPVFNEDSVLDDPYIKNEIYKINKRVQGLAHIISQADQNIFRVKRSEQRNTGIIKILSGQDACNHYLFTSSMSSEVVTVGFETTYPATGPLAEVLDEQREVSVKAGSFYDVFEPYAVHLYQIRKPYIEGSSCL